jgi:hypothetical protein
MSDQVKITGKLVQASDGKCNLEFQINNQLHKLTLPAAILNQLALNRNLKDKTIQVVVPTSKSAEKYVVHTSIPEGLKVSNYELSSIQNIGDNKVTVKFDEFGEYKYINAEGGIVSDKSSVLAPIVPAIESTPPPPPPPPERKPTYSISGANMNLDKDQEGKMLVSVTGLHTSEKGRLTVLFDPTTVQYKESNSTNRQIKIDKTQAGEGVLSISWNQKLYGNELKKMAELQFKAVGTPGSSSQIKFSDSNIQSEGKGAELQSVKNGTISIKDKFVLPPWIYWAGAGLAVLLLALLIFLNSCNWFGWTCPEIDSANARQFFEKYYQLGDEKDYLGQMNMMAFNLEKFYDSTGTDRASVLKFSENYYRTILDSSSTVLLDSGYVTKSSGRPPEGQFSASTVFEYIIQYYYRTRTGEEELLNIKVRSKLVKLNNDSLRLRSIEEISRTEVDEDDDGFGFLQDCNDKNARINPSVSEICGNNVDDNCDGQIDENCPPPSSDSDGDGVPDNRDECENTPSGVRVDYKGCPLPPGYKDSDGDGVIDEKDRCKNTPPDTPVDGTGCPIKDSDGDGVPDNRDFCPDTDPGVEVDQRGCEIETPKTTDSDEDGIFDSDDRCKFRKGPSSNQGCPEINIDDPIVLIKGNGPKMVKVDFDSKPRDQFRWSISSSNLKISNNNVLNPSMQSSDFGLMSARLVITNQDDQYEESVSVQICSQISEKELEKYLNDIAKRGQYDPGNFIPNYVNQKYNDAIELFEDLCASCYVTENGKATGLDIQDFSDSKLATQGSYVTKVDVQNIRYDNSSCKIEKIGLKRNY